MNTTPHPPDAAEAQKVLESFRLSRIILPVILGLGAVAYLFYRQFDADKFRQIAWDTHAFAWLFGALLLLVLRHISYAWRLRTITNGTFTWRKCLELIVLWEFSCAVTPTSKGGPLVMLFVLGRERLSAGRTAAAVFYATLCDSGFFVLSVPLFLLLWGPRMLYPGMENYGDVGLASGTFFATYTMMASYFLFLLFFLVLRPQYASWLIHWLAKRPFLQRFSKGLTRLGDEFVLATETMRRQPLRYHLQVLLGTIGAWTCKFLMINCIIIALVPDTPVDGSTQAFIYARLVAMFVIMAFSPTPGGAGLAEIALAGFISDYVPSGIGLVVALIWRGMAYYGYLLMGAIIVPAWIAEKAGEAHKPHIPDPKSVVN